MKASDTQSVHDGCESLGFYAINRAYFQSKARRDIVVTVAKEDE